MLQGLIYYGLATEHGLPSNVTSMLVPFVSDDGATGTAAADTEAYGSICVAHLAVAVAVHVDVDVDVTVAVLIDACVVLQ